VCCSSAYATNKKKTKIDKKKLPRRSLLMSLMLQQAGGSRLIHKISLTAYLYNQKGCECMGQSQQSLCK
jgi:hypothetical protein